MSHPVALGPNQVARCATVPAPADRLYDLLADPHQHPDVDGSGTVRAVVTGPRRVGEGDTFTIAMRRFGMPYRITSTVTRAEPGSVLEWRHPQGHHWRWEFTALDADTTEVTEVFDYRGSHTRATLRLMRIPTANDRGIAATLDGLSRRYGGA